MNNASEHVYALGRQFRRNSEYWFPQLHARDFASIKTHYVLGLVGEVGELVNLLKKMDTGQTTIAMDEVRFELADIFTYLLLLADHFEIDLVDASLQKQEIVRQRWE